MHFRKTNPSLTMMTRFNFSLPKEPYYNTFTSVWWCVMQSLQRSHQQLPAANIPFLPRRLPCEKVELMLQRHRRHPWCMWSGCQRPHFLLSGLKWSGQTQILAQPAPPRWFQRSYQSLTFLYEPLWEESQGSPLQCLKVGPFLVVKQVSSFGKSTGTWGKENISRNGSEMPQKYTRVRKETNILLNIINIISNYTILWDWDSPNIWWMYCTSVRFVMQSPQMRHQRLPSATSVNNSKSAKKKAPFLPRRLPCEKVELMLQRHRRRPWCMWSGC